MSLLQLGQYLYKLWTVVADQRWVVDWVIDAVRHDLLGDGGRRALDKKTVAGASRFHAIGMPEHQKGPEGPDLTF